MPNPRKGYSISKPPTHVNIDIHIINENEL